NAYDIEQGNDIVCASRQQVERLATLLELSAPAAIERVNAEAHDPGACFAGSLAYVRGAQVGTVRSRAGTFEIFELLVRRGCHRQCVPVALTCSLFFDRAD